MELCVEGHSAALVIRSHSKPAHNTTHPVLQPMMIESCLCRVPLITQFYGAFQDAYQIFLVMEYCAGGDLLDRLLDEGRAMSERRVILEVAVPLLKTLQHLHSYSIIHRCPSVPTLY